MADTNLMFLRGLQSSINGMTTSIDGAFYLTTDTNRLYIGNPTGGAPIALNRDIGVVSNVANLPNVPPAADKDFYYCEAENVFAFYSAKQGKWVQINPDTDTNDDTKVVEIKFGEGIVDEVENTISYPVTIKNKTTDKDGKETESIITIDDALVLTSDLVASIIPEAAEVSLDNSYAGSTLTIENKGAGSAAGSVKLTQGNNVVFQYANDELTIGAVDTTYTFGVDGTNKAVTYAGTNGAEGTIAAFKSGAGITVEANANDKSFTIKHSDTSTQATAELTELGATSVHEFDIFDKIALDDHGHVTGIETRTVKVTDNDTYITEVVDSAVGDWKVILNQNNGKELEVDFSADAEALKEALEKTIEDGLAAANTALTYKGIVSYYADLTDAAASAEVGDVYMVAQAFSNNQTGSNRVEYKVGDLVIATSSKASDTGKIDEDASLVWVRVPSGDEMMIDTHFTGKVDTTASGVVKFAVQQVGIDGADDATKGDTLIIKEGNDIKITHSAGETTVAHKTYDEVTPVAEAKGLNATSVSAVTGIEVTNGHVTGITTKQVDLMTYDLVGQDNKIILKHSDGAEGDFIEVSGDSTWINATVADEKLTITHAGPSTAATSVVAANNGTTLTHGGTFSAITEVAYDAKGHMVSAKADTFTLPADNDTTYTVGVSAKSDNNVLTGSQTAANPYVGILGSNGSFSGMQMKSESQNISVKGSAGAVSINMVWGTF